MFSKRNFVALMAALSAAALLAGCGDDAKSPTAITDTAPPAVPANLQAHSQDSVVQLVWQENVIDADLAGYRIWRTVNGQIHPLVAIPQGENQYEDAYAAAGQLNTYSVAAVDLSGNESARSSVQVYVVSGDTHVSSGGF